MKHHQYGTVNPASAPRIIQQQPPPPYNPSFAATVPQSAMPVPHIISMAPPHLGQTPVRMMCPNCQNEIFTNVETEYSSKQHLICLLIFLTGLIWFSCLPYCIKSYAHFRHNCPQCGMHVGSYSK